MMNHLDKTTDAEFGEDLIEDLLENVVVKFGENKTKKLLNETLRCDSGALDFVLGLLSGIK